MIEDFRSHPDLLDTLVNWHLSEWPKDQPEKRRKNLEGHLDSDGLPITKIAFLNTRPVGAVSLLRYQRLGGIDEGAWLANLVVVEQFRTLGIGKKLVECIESLAHQLGFSRIRLTSEQSVVAYYQYLGWSVLSSRVLNGKPIHIMEKCLIS